MAFREIRDQDGRAWSVWDTNPHEFAGRSIIAREYAAGWLTFECGDEKRRLAPTPVGWEALDAAELVRLLENAEPVPARVAR